MNNFMKRSAFILLAAGGLFVSGYGMVDLTSQQLNAKMAQHAILAQDSKLIEYWLHDRSANEIDIDWQDANGDTVLIHAVRMKNADAIESALAFVEADINVQNNNGDTALIEAARGGDAAIVTMLLEARADAGVEVDINVQNNNGDTALIEAARGGDATIVTMLLEACANARILNNQGQTALDVAFAQGHNNVVALLANLVTNRNVISNIVAQQWETLPLEVLDYEIMSFLP